MALSSGTVPRSSMPDPDSCSSKAGTKVVNRIASRLWVGVAMIDERERERENENERERE